ncbi:unnamed protein product [Owenia fusiformis]|uniref:EFR3-like protein n=1 Tax=Owenia fusiformis TaxID=6347 RepID=A0A8S4N090_OWEFU|nr:unnamed protein product [Owenia fusiformis]
MLFLTQSVEQKLMMYWKGHLDNHRLWVPNDFAVKCFKVVMFSVQAQYGYVVVQMLMSHLDEHSKSQPRMKASIVDVLAETVLIAAGGSIGPSVLEVFNTLLRHIRVSVDNKTTDKDRLSDEKKFQESCINTIGEFANNLPDYQKIEIMMFVMGKVNTSTDDKPSDSKDVMLQTMLLKTLLTVATKYKTVLMSNAFTLPFLEPLMRMSISSDPGIRLLVQEILHTLLDRHNNLPKLKTVKIMADISQLSLTVEKPPRQDVMFMKKNGSQFYWHLYENMQQLSNKLENFAALYITLALLGLEMGADEILVELFRLSLGMQEMACNSTSLPSKHRCCIHAVVAAYYNLMSQLTAIPALCQHITQVIEIREKEARHLLPDEAFTENKQWTSPEGPKPEWLFDQDIISEALHSSGLDTTKLGTPFMNKLSIQLGSDGVDGVTGSVSDINSISIDLESAASTPGMTRRRFSTEITVETLKKVLADSSQDREEEKAKQAEILHMFREGPFEEIVAKSEARATRFHSKVDEILKMLDEQAESVENQDIDRDITNIDEPIPIYEIKYPDLFVY